MKTYLPFQVSIGLLVALIAGCSSSESTGPQSSNQDLNIGIIDSDSPVDPISNAMDGIEVENIPEPLASSILNRNNLYDVVSEVVSLLNVEPMEDIVLLERQAVDDDTLPSNSSSINNAGMIDYMLLPVLGTNLNGFATELFEYDCLVSGSQSVYIDAGSVGQGIRDRLYDNCQNGSYVYNGTAGNRSGARGVVAFQPFADFSVEDNSGNRTTLSGTRFSGNTSFARVLHRMGWNETHLNQTEPAGTLQVVDYSITKQTNELDSGAFFATVQAMFLVSASWTNNNELIVTTSLSFNEGFSEEVSTPFQWQSGSIEIVASDNSQIRVEPLDETSNSWSFLLDDQAIDILPATGDYRVSCGYAAACPE